MLEELHDIKNRLGFMAKIIGGRDSTSLFYVVIPEQMAILDTEIAIKEFGKFGIELSGIIVNQVYPKELLGDPNVPDFLKSRVRMQQGNLEIIHRKFGERIVAEVPMDKEPKGLEMLAKTAGIVSCLHNHLPKTTNTSFFGGKGGVGKTVLASASAIYLASLGKRVLLCSTNPVHSLSSCFGQQFIGRGRDTGGRL